MLKLLAAAVLALILASPAWADERWPYCKTSIKRPNLYLLWMGDPLCPDTPSVRAYKACVQNVLAKDALDGLVPDPQFPTCQKLEKALDRVLRAG